MGGKDAASEELALGIVVVIERGSPAVLFKKLGILAQRDARADGVNNVDTQRREEVSHAKFRRDDVSGEDVLLGLGQEPVCSGILVVIHD